MPIIAREPTSSYTPPPEGLHQAVCCDVIDLGVLPSQWGERHKVRLVWQVLVDGQRYRVQKTYTLSLHERAALRKDLESWRGRKYLAGELRGGIDLERLIGQNCQIHVVHELGADGQTWGLVQAILPLPRSMRPIAPEGYVRDPGRPAAAAAPDPEPDPEAVDDVPF